MVGAILHLSENINRIDVFLQSNKGEKKMVGLDRAVVWVELEVEADLVILAIQKRFKDIQPKKLAGTTQTFIINQENINEIKVREKQDKVVVKIDFSYARFGNLDNLYPLSDSTKKMIVDMKILTILEDITLEKISLSQIKYDYLEICIQEEIKSFYDFHNIIITFYKALSRNIKAKERLQFNNFDVNQDFFYSTGFIFQMDKGWKLRLYSKSHEHNKKNINKSYGAKMRIEHKLSSTMIKYFGYSNIVEDLTIEYLKESVVNKIGLILVKYLTSEIERDIKILLEKMKGYKSREIKTLVRDLQEHILDEKVVGYIITTLSEKGSRQTIRYRIQVKEALEEAQTRGSPKRNNFGNKERLEFFINNLLQIKSKVKCSYSEGLTISFM